MIKIVQLGNSATIRKVTRDLNLKKLFKKDGFLILLTRNKTNKFITGILIFIICIFIGLFFLISYFRVWKIYEDETKTTVIELKKLFLKDTVCNLINEIGIEKEATIEYFKKVVDWKFDVYYEKVQICDDFVDSLIADFKSGAEQEGNPIKWTVFIWDDSEKVYYDPQSFYNQNVEATVDRIKSLMVYYKTIEHNNISCLFGFTKEHVDDTTKIKIIEKIKRSEFSNDSYIWVNEILNYDGGDNYAVRRVHPNLPETEGMYLSTNLIDIKGNLPYLTELEGVKKDGELFFWYYFKELNSEDISEKISYARLYEEYDWIIAMGVQNNEIDRFIEISSQKAKGSTFNKAIQLLLILIIIVIIGIVLIIVIEKLQSKHSKKQIELKASIDSLTSVKTRQFGMDYLENIFNEYKNNKIAQDIALMVFDIDNFKGYNDYYGHSEGDTILKETAKIINKSIRSTDELFRWGGDEFVGIFRGVNREYAIPFANKILEAVSSSKLKIGDEIATIEISTGISHFKITDKEYLDALRRADQAMYISKASGKNKVSLL
jgi:diguanylate cyclase (GGDEF)-like protein